MSDDPDHIDDPDFPNAHWGNIGNPLPDWRAIDQEDDADDDRELPETPPDVIAILGFDPLDEIEDGTEAE